MIGSILFAIGIVALAALVIVIGTFLVSTLIGIIKKHHYKKVALKRAKKLMHEVAEGIKKDVIKADVQDLNELEKLLGPEGCVEFTVDKDGNVNPDDIQLLQADNMEQKLSSLFDQNNGLLVYQT